MFIIPTTRKCTKAIHSAINEISLYKCAPDEEIEFVLLEQMKGDISEDNSRILKNITNDKIKIRHIYADDIDEICNKYFEKQKSGHSDNESSLFRQCYSYGMTYNRIFVIAAILGADYIHRRDSDVFMQVIEGNNLSPLEIEMKYLGKNMCDTSSELQND